MKDQFKSQLNKMLCGCPGGLKCKHCNPSKGGNKKRVNRIVRARLKKEMDMTFYREEEEK